MRFNRDVVTRLEQSREFLRENVDRLVTLDEAADQAFFSPYHYHRLFCELYGQTPLGFLTGVRTETAKRLLLMDTMSVSEICYAVGYQSLGTFSTRFRQATGLSPSEYREQARRLYTLGEIWTYKFVPHCFVARSSF